MAPLIWRPWCLRSNWLTMPKGRPISRACKPGCTCGRHTNANHKPDCKCPLCRPRMPKRGRWRPDKRPDRCKCKHIESRHDEFGCTVCDLCTEFVAYDSPAKPKDRTFAREVHRLGFIAHTGDMATCSTCWGTVKIGGMHSVSCVINAKAHKQLCSKSSGKAKENCSPNRAIGSRIE